MSGLHRQLQDYLAIRRAMGFTMKRHAKLLGQFVDFLAAHDAATITIEDALAWAGAPSAADPRWWAARLSMVRGFAVHLHALDPAHQVPPHGLMPSRSRRTVVPYLYTDPEIAALVHAAGELSGPLRAATYQTGCLAEGSAEGFDEGGGRRPAAAVGQRGNCFVAGQQVQCVVEAQLDASLEECQAEVAAKQTAQGAVARADVAAEFGKGAAVGGVVTDEVADCSHPGVGRRGELDRLLRGRVQLVEQDRPPPLAFGGLVVRVAGAGKDQLAQQRPAAFAQDLASTTVQPQRPGPPRLVIVDLTTGSVMSGPL